ncbi:HAD family phosphatase [Comamonadaceae bacterium M7527]|nr:HAD family phosphatase [Comamonadaceae bacterium M7527]
MASNTAVVFDFGGVVFHWQPAQLLQQVVPHLAPNEASALALKDAIFQGLTLTSDWALFDQGYIEPDALAQRIAARTGLAKADVAAVIAAIPEHLTAKRDTVALIEQLAAQGVPLFFLSNMPAPYARYLQTRHAFLKHFKAGVFSADVGCSKPDPRIYQLALAATGLQACDLVFVDDLTDNIDVAKSLGWRGVVFDHAAQCATELAPLLA